MGAAGQRLVTFVDRMPQAIWVAAAPSATSPLSAAGWVLPAGQSVPVTTPDKGTGSFALASQVRTASHARRGHRSVDWPE